MHFLTKTEDIDPASEIGAVAESCSPIGHALEGPADAARTAEFCRTVGASHLIVDHYQADAPYQRVLLDAGLRWLQFDGTARTPIWADWIINSSPTARTEDYQQVKRNPQAKVLIGPRYAILRDEFREIATRPCDRPIQRVLVTFGGGDDRGAIEFVLSSLVNRIEPQIDFLVVSGKSNPRNTNLIQWAESYGGGRVAIEIEPTDVARLFASCDLAIMAGGTSTYEAACCQVPMILVSIAENQTRHGAAWEKSGAAIFLGDLANTSETHLRNSFNQLRGSSQKRAELCTTAHSICDGLGALRVADAILN
jgi:spore coat polysaccharide biosynthesis predicted glycosyltransferase SpsG